MQKGPQTEAEKQALIKKLQQQVEDTTEVAVDNIGLVVERGERLEEIIDTTRQTEEQALEFSGNARQMYIKAKFQNWALGAAIFGMLLGAGYGFSMGASVPMVLASTGLGGVLFYGAMWMASGAIQSFMQLPFFSFAFETTPTLDQHADNQLKNSATPELAVSPVLAKAYALHASTYRDRAPLVEETLGDNHSLSLRS